VGAFEALAGRLVRVLEAAVAAPEVAIGRLEILSAAERRTLLQEWTATERVLPAATLPQLFAAQAAATPDAVAVVVCGRAAQLWGVGCARQPACASSARAQGWERRAWWGCAWSARWSWWLRSSPSSRPAAAICRSTPAYPRERLGFMLADAGAAVLISATGLRDRVDAPGVRRLELDGAAAAIAAHPKSAPADVVGPHNLAYVIYTSGSTGTPRASPSPIRTSCDCSAPLNICSASTRMTFGPYSTPSLSISQCGRFGVRFSMAVD